ISAVNQQTILRNIATRIHMIDPPTARLVLIRVDQAVSKKPLQFYQSLIERGQRDPERLTVEHLCPKGEIAEGDWLTLFPRRTVRHRASQCIGNLVLVTEAQNKLGSQRDFAAKKQLFFSDGRHAALYLTDMLRGERTWDGAAIARRYNLIMTAVT